MYHGEDLAKANHASVSGVSGALSAARAVQTEVGPKVTLVEVITSAEVLHSDLLDRAAFAERLADAVAGVVPTPGEAQERGRPVDGLVETAADRIGRCGEPSHRIRMALERIGRALG